MIENLSIQEVLTVGFGGAFGSLVKDILSDGCIQLPSIDGKKLYLGFVAGALIGAFVGIVIDGSFVTALTAGYMGVGVIKQLVGPTKREEIKREDVIIKAEGVKTELAKDK